LYSITDGATEALNLLGLIPESGAIAIFYFYFLSLSAENVGSFIFFLFLFFGPIMKLLFRYFLFFGRKKKILLRSASTEQHRRNSYVAEIAPHSVCKLIYS